MIELALFRCIPFGSSPEYTAEHQENVNEAAWAAQNYFEWLGMPRKVSGHVFEGDNSTAPPLPRSGYPLRDGFGRKAITAIEKENGWDFDYHLLLVSQVAQMCGRAECPGEWGVVFGNTPTSPCGDLTVWHEHLHQCGENHSGNIKNGSFDYYGDGTCILGGHNLCAPNAPHQYRLGLLNERECLEITESGEYLLAPLELRERDLFPNEYRALKLGDFFLSIRKCIGTPQFMQHPERLYTHEVGLHMMGKKVIDEEPWKGKRFTYRHKDLWPGENNTLPNGVAVEYLSYEQERAEVRVTMG